MQVTKEYRIEADCPLFFRNIWLSLQRIALIQGQVVSHVYMRGHVTILCEQPGMIEECLEHHSVKYDTYTRCQECGKPVLKGGLVFGRCVMCTPIQMEGDSNAFL